MNVDFKGYNENVITFEADSTVTDKGVAVKMISNGKVGAAGDGEAFIGVVAGINDGFAAVQTNGTVTMEKSGAIPIGYQKLVSAGGGKVKTNSSTGREYLVINSDADGVCFIL